MPAAPYDRFDLGRVTDEPEDRRLVSAHKLVEIFSGITRKRLRLRDGHGCSDGNDVVVPFNAKDMFKQVEHRLAHVLFETNAVAKSTFIQEYVKRVAEQTEKQGEVLESHQKQALGVLLSEILSVVECHRVESLWSMLYQGSYLWGREEARKDATHLMDKAHESIGTMLSILEAGLNPPAGELDRFKPYLIEALRKTEKRGYNATLIVTKWLVTHLVSELLRQSKDLPPQPEAPPVPDLVVALPGAPKTQDQEDDQDESEDPQESDISPKPDDTSEAESTGAGSNQTPEDDAEADESGSAEGPGKESKNAPTDQEAKGQGEGEGIPDDQPGSGKWLPPKTDVSQKERARALKNLLDKIKDKKDQFEDTKRPDTSSAGEARKAAKLISEALKADISDTKALEEALNESKQRMEAAIEAARDIGANVVTLDDKIRKETEAKVVFRDVRAVDVREPGRLPPEDILTIQRLRSLFNRILGRRKTLLEESGSSVDVEAYIQSRVMGSPEPEIFRHEARGRGFQFLLLIDRSGSMAGRKQLESERACRILTRALRYPFVDLHVWGFQSLGDGQVDISRYDPKLESFDGAKSAIGGVTPLHLAVQVAHSFLSRGGDGDSKHILAVTDGLPVYNDREGRRLDIRHLLIASRSEVRKSRAKGILTSGALIGNDITPLEMGFLFGHERNWRMLSDQTLGEDLVRLVVSSFMTFLKGM